MDDTIRASIILIIEKQPGITLAELLLCVDGAKNSLVFELILTRQIYTDLSAAFLGDEEQVRLFRDRVAATFFARLAESQSQQNKCTLRAGDLLPGTTLKWNGVSAELLLVGKTEVTLNCGDGHYPTIEVREFERLLKEGKITGYTLCTRIDPKAKEYELASRRRLTREQMLEALGKEEVVKRILAGERVAASDNEARKHRQWVANYNEAKAKHGNGLIGLMPKPRKGNRTDRLDMIDPELRPTMMKFIKEEVETAVNKTKSALYGAFRKLCEKLKFEKTPSYKIFVEAIKSREGAEQTEKMEGSKAAYQVQEHIDDEYYTTPVHGDRPWQYAHLDHTLMDVKLRHSKKSKKKFRRRAWVSLLIDARTRRILAHYISFESPSRVSCMMVIRECVRRHGRLPECIVVDGGNEFRSTYFETLLSHNHCDVQWRPKTKPRFGSIIERFIHTLNKQVLHNLLGNTKATKNVRQMTKAVDPDEHAIWTLPLLDEALEEYFYEQYDTREHSSLSQSPRDEWDDLINKYDTPEPDKIEYDQIFLIETMIPVRNETLLVQRSRGLKVFGTWYKAKELKDNKVIGTKVEVLYDPLDVSHVYAYVRGSWVECLAPPGVFALLRGKSVQMMRAISEEERELVKDYGRGANNRFEELASQQAAREETEREEEQRLADEALKEIADRKDRLTLVKTDGSSSQGGAQAEGDKEDESEQEIDVRKLKAFGRARRG